MHFHKRFFRRVLTALVLLGSLGVLGCSTGLPSTHDVEGKVVYKDGDVKLLEGGTVEFISVADPMISATGQIQPDGSYSLTTWTKDGKKEVQGAVGGEHKVQVIPPNPEEAETKRLIDRTIQDSETSGITVKVPDGNYTIEVYRKRPKGK